jgi:RNA polymerase sigma-70 factor (ECF subfamily)
MDGSCSCAALSPLPDEDLVARFRQGEIEAFAQLHARYRRRILRTAYRITRNTEDAQDATQEIFLKLYRSLHSWDGRRAQLSTWIYRMAANHAIDAWRSRRRGAEPLTLQEGAAAAEVAGRQHPADSPLASLQHREALRAVVRCANRLPRVQKRLFLQRYFLGASMEELSHREGLRLGTVKGLLHRATHSVRRRVRATAEQQVQQVSVLK